MASWQEEADAEWRALPFSERMKRVQIAGARTQTRTVVDKASDVKREEVIHEDTGKLGGYQYTAGDGSQSGRVFPEVIPNPEVVHDLQQAARHAIADSKPGRTISLGT